MRMDYHAVLVSNHFYHIYNRTNGQDILFRNHENRDFFLQKWSLYLSPYVETYAYCLMGNHFHFIIRVKSVDETFRNAVQQEKTQAAFKFLAGAIDVNTFLEDQYKRLFSSYSSAYNKMFQRHGSLFQKRFRRVLIKQQGVLLNKICYVHHNPIHHGYTTVYDSWTYSSYNAYFSKASTQLEREKGLLLFTNLNEFRQTHEIYRQNRLGFSRDEIEAD